MKKNIQFYFDPVSPYVYLAWTQLEAFAQEMNVTFQFMPVLFAGLLNAHGQKGPAEIPSKRMYTFKDAVRLAHYYGVPLRLPPKHPFNPLNSLRICLALEHEPERQKWAGALLTATWVDHQDVSDPLVLQEIAAELGFSVGALWEKSQSNEIKEALKHYTQQAIDKGIFGVPSFYVDHELFWGSDRFFLLKAYLEGRGAGHFDAEAVNRMPRGADRKVLSAG